VIVWQETLMKGNEALSEAAIRAGLQGFLRLSLLHLRMRFPPIWLSTSLCGAESICRQKVKLRPSTWSMVRPGAGARVMTSSSSPGISLKQEGISYIAAAQLPCVIVNVVRNGPGFGRNSAGPRRLFPSREGRRAWGLPPDCPGPWQCARNGGSDHPGL
jgi:2-oxoglutarate ferredoxin oxidoreductase subunit alpha